MATYLREVKNLLTPEQWDDAIYAVTYDKAKLAEISLRNRCSTLRAKEASATDATLVPDPVLVEAADGAKRLDIAEPSAAGAWRDAKGALAESAALAYRAPDPDEEWDEPTNGITPPKPQPASAPSAEAGDASELHQDVLSWPISFKQRQSVQKACEEIAKLRAELERYRQAAGYRDEKSEADSAALQRCTFALGGETWRGLAERLHRENEALRASAAGGKGVARAVAELEAVKKHARSYSVVVGQESTDTLAGIGGMLCHVETFLDELIAALQSEAQPPAVPAGVVRECSAPCMAFTGMEGSRWTTTCSKCDKHGRPAPETSAPSAPEPVSSRGGYAGAPDADTLRHLGECDDVKKFRKRVDDLRAEIDAALRQRGPVEPAGAVEPAHVWMPKLATGDAGEWEQHFDQLILQMSRSGRLVGDEPERLGFLVRRGVQLMRRTDTEKNDAQAHRDRDREPLPLPPAEDRQPAREAQHRDRGVPVAGEEAGDGVPRGPRTGDRADEAGGSPHVGEPVAGVRLEDGRVATPAKEAGRSGLHPLVATLAKWRKECDDEAAGIGEPTTRGRDRQIEFLAGQSKGLHRAENEAAKLLAPPAPLTEAQAAGLVDEHRDAAMAWARDPCHMTAASETWPRLEQARAALLRHLTASAAGGEAKP
jgi:hypothetical protein